VTMDLSEFLLARIAEDEAVARQSVTHGTGGLPQQTPGLWNGPGQYPIMHAQRLLADCEARRRIVDEAQTARSALDSIRDTFAGLDDPRARVERASYSATERVWFDALRLLALPYASHPDYRSEWTP
jgi:hypothetical protein